MALHLNYIPNYQLEQNLLRKQMVEDIHKQFVKFINVVALRGVSGIGKTHIVKNYLATYETVYDYIIWIDAGNDLQDAFLNDITLLKNIGLAAFEHVNRTKEQKGLDWTKIVYTLQKQKGRGLLVIDNLKKQLRDNENIHLELIEQLKRSCKKLSILITSTEVQKNIPTIEVNPLTNEEAVNLFHIYYPNINNDMPIIAEIVSYAGHHPTLIRLLAHIFQFKKDLDVSEIWQAWKENPIYQKQLAFEINPSRDKLNDSLLVPKNEAISQAKIENCLQQCVEESKIGENELEWELFCVLSIFPSYKIAWKNLFKMIENEENLLEYEKAFHALIEKGWVQVIDMENKYYDCSYFVQVFICRKVAFNEQSIDQSLPFLGTILPKVATESLWESIDWLRYAESAFCMIEYETSNLAILGNYIAQLYRKVEDFEKAFIFIVKSLAIFEKLDAPDPYQFASTYNNLAICYQYAYNFEKSLENYLKTAEVYEKRLLPKNPELAEVYSNISLNYYATNTLEESLTYQQKAIKIYEKIYPDGHFSLALSYGIVSLIYKGMGDFKKSLRYALKALEIRKKVSPDDAFELAESYISLSEIYLDMNNLPLSLEYGLMTVKIYENELPLDHIQLLTTYNHLGAIYRAMNDVENTFSNYLKAMLLGEKYLTEPHHKQEETYYNLSIIYRDSNVLDKALECALKGLNVCQKTMPDNGTKQLLIYENLAFIYQRLKKWAKGLDAGFKCIAICEKFGENSKHKIGAYEGGISFCYFALSNWDKALFYMKSSLNTYLTVPDVTQEKAMPLIESMRFLITKIGEIKNPAYVAPYKKWLEEACAEHFGL